MKNYYIFIAFFFLLFACNSLEPETYQTEIAKMNDTLFKALPSVKRVSVEVKTDFGAELKITLGDKSLFNAADSNREKATKKITSIANAVFHEKLPGKGKVVFVEEENTIVSKEGTEKIVKMNMEKK